MTKTEQRTVRVAPKRIWLQHDPEKTGEPFDTAYEVTWCSDKINENDIEYVRADRARAEAKRRKR